MYEEIQVALQILNWTTKQCIQVSTLIYTLICVRHRNTHRFTGKTSGSNVSIVSLTIIRVEEDNQKRFTFLCFIKMMIDIQEKTINKDHKEVQRATYIIFTIVHLLLQYKILEKYPFSVLSMGSWGSHSSSLTLKNKLTF